MTAPGPTSPAACHGRVREPGVYFDEIRPSMAKTGLGRGLQNLMKEPPVAPRTDNPSEKPALVTPGMAALLRGGNDDAKAQSQSVGTDDPAKTRAAGRKRKMVQ